MSGHQGLRRRFRDDDRRRGIREHERDAILRIRRIQGHVRRARSEDGKQRGHQLGSPRQTEADAHFGAGAGMRR
jgi:hypothetical protein